MSKLAGRARLVYRVKRVNYFRCLLCGTTLPASAIARHVARCSKPAQEKPDAHAANRLPYRDD